MCPFFANFIRWHHTRIYPIEKVNIQTLNKPVLLELFLEYKSLKLTHLDKYESGILEFRVAFAASL